MVFLIRFNYNIYIRLRREIMEIILDILYLYIAIYTFYFLALAVRNLNDGKFKIERKYALHEEKDNLAVVIYAHNNKDNLEKLIHQLKMQDYPIANFKVFLILDNSTDGSQELYRNDNFIHVINIKDVGTVGKDQAISLLLEQLSKDDYIDSFVFIDADRGISPNFLSTINAALVRSSVLSGETIIDTDNLGPVDKIKAAYQKYHMNFIRRARSLFGLASAADSGVFIVKKEIVTQIGDVDFKDINTELKYSLLLSKIKYPCTFNPNIQTIADSTSYVFRKPRFSTRLDLFRNALPQIFGKNFVFSEHVLSLIYPNIWTLLIGYAIILKHSYSSFFFVDFKLVVFTFILLIIGFALSLIDAKLTPKEIVRLCLYPVYSLCHITKNFPPVRMLVNKIRNREDLPQNTEKFDVDVVVTTNKSNLNCKLQFISENGLAKIRFMYKNKKFTTQSHLRMIDALQELKMKLDDYGFILRICSCCTHYSPCIDGSTNMLKGFCNSDYPSPSIKEPKPTTIWNTCNDFCPAQLNSLIAEMVRDSQAE